MHEDGGGEDAQEPQCLEQTHVHPFPSLRVFQSSLFIYLEDISCQKKDIISSTTRSVILTHQPRRTTTAGGAHPQKSPSPDRPFIRL